MLRKLLTFAAGWLAFAGLLAFMGLPHLPEGVQQWILLIVFGPPAYLLLSAIGELLGEAFGRLPGIRQGNAFVERRTQGRELSFLRIGWYLLVGLAAMALVVGGTWVARNYF